jgi:hypothetical protein
VYDSITFYCRILWRLSCGEHDRLGKAADVILKLPVKKF